VAELKDLYRSKLFKQIK